MSEVMQSLHSIKPNKNIDLCFSSIMSFLSFHSRTIYLYSQTSNRNKHNAKMKCKVCYDKNYTLKSNSSFTQENQPSVVFVNISAIHIHCQSIKNYINLFTHPHIHKHMEQPLFHTHTHTNTYIPIQHPIQQ